MMAAKSSRSSPTMTRERYSFCYQASIWQKLDAMNQNNGLAEITDEFLRNTSIHGLRYIGQRNRPVFERILWLSLVIVGCSLSVWMCVLEWNKWNESSLLVTRDPTIIIHDPKEFPVVTMCSTNKISKKKLADVRREPKYNWMNYSSMVKTVRYMTKFDGLLSQDEEEKFKKLLQELTEHDIGITDLTEVVRQVSPTCSDLVVDCQWRSSFVACQRIMSLRLTDDGYCCSLDISALDNGDGNGSSNTVYDYGVHSALRLILDPNLNDNALSTVTIDGFKILLHNKDEFADVTERGFIVGSGYENFVALNSFSVSYTPAVEAVSFDRRQCHIEGEGSLKYSQGVNYTRSSCLFECRAEKVLELCHCLPYFIKVGAPVPTCNLLAYPCVINFYVRAIFMASVTANCTCPATCKDQWFTTEISSAPLSPTGFSATRNFKRVSKSRKMDANYSTKLIGLRIFFKYNAGESFSMDVPFGNKELLASVGGILGLGLGFSIISAIELCYFLCCGWYFRKKRSIEQTTVNCSMCKSKSLNKKKFRRPHRVIKVLPGPKKRTIAWLNTISK